MSGGSSSSDAAKAAASARLSGLAAAPGARGSCCDGHGGSPPLPPRVAREGCMSRRLHRVSFALVLGAFGLGAWAPPALPQAASVPADPGPMPHPVEFFRKPADAGTALPCKKGGAVPTRPDDLLRKNQQAYHMANNLRRWGEIHYEFQGPQSACPDWGQVIAKWQGMAGLPVTGVFTQAESDSVLAERQRVEPQWKAAFDQWTAARVAMRAAGGELPEDRVARERGMAAAGPASVARPAPVGPPEKQAFGLSLGVSLGSQLPRCRESKRWSDPFGFDRTVTCHAPASRHGRSSANYDIELEAEWVSDTTHEQFEVDVFAMILFSEADQPGLVAGDLKALLVDGRLEGIGFSPRDKQAVLAAFESRYGKPEFEPVPMKNDQGGTWMGERYRFRANDVSATLNCVGFNTSQCSYAQILTERGLQALRGERQREVQKGVGF
jgi:hypothetical protein